MNFLEELVAEWYEYRGYFIKKNVLVGKRPAGGHECELDVVAFHPQTKHLVHIEASMDADKKETRDRRFTKKFDAGLKYIPELFSGLLDNDHHIEQHSLMVFISTSEEVIIAGKPAMHVSELLKQITEHFAEFSMLKRQAPQQYPLLRTIQFTTQYKDLLYNPTN